jgi:membrane fusion protein (multidrug efflux system)
MNKKKIIQIAGAIAAILTIYVTYEHFTYITTDNAQIQAKTVMLAAKTPGYVAKINVEENQKVKAGQILLELDSRDFENMHSQMSNEVASAQARAHDAEKNFKRLGELYAKGAVSQQQYDSASTLHLESKAKYMAIQAQNNQAQLNVEYSKIKAPTDGFIAKKSVELGQLASPGTPLIGFVSSDERWLTANIKETDLNHVVVGHKVDVRVDAIDGKKFEGVVDGIGSATGATFTLLPPDNATGNFTKVVQRVPVKIKLVHLTESDIEQLKAGLSAEVSIHIR